MNESAAFLLHPVVSLNEKGEQVVQREMRDHARERQRWVIGIPALLLCLAGFLWMKDRDTRDSTSP